MHLEGEAISKPGADIERELRERIQFLEHRLRDDRPYLHLYKLGAAGFLSSVFSLLVWGFTGVAAPFHPAFAGLAIPVSISVMGMAFLIHKEEQKNWKNNTPFQRKDKS